MILIFINLYYRIIKAKSWEYKFTIRSWDWMQPRVSTSFWMKKPRWWLSRQTTTAKRHTLLIVCSQSNCSSKCLRALPSTTVPIKMDYTFSRLDNSIVATNSLHSSSSCSTRTWSLSNQDWYKPTLDSLTSTPWTQCRPEHLRGRTGIMPLANKSMMPYYKREMDSYHSCNN